MDETGWHTFPVISLHEPNTLQKQHKIILKLKVTNEIVGTTDISLPGTHRMHKDKRTRPGLPWKYAVESSDNDDDDAAWVLKQM